MTCFVEYDRINSRRKSIALCGELVAARDISNEPTCPECRRRLAVTEDETFGPRLAGTQVQSHPFDPLAGYRPKGGAR
jgi:hypothetical protein